MVTTVITQAPGAGPNNYHTGWWNVTVPAGYITGAGAILKLDIEKPNAETGFQTTIWGCGWQANGGWIDSVANPFTGTNVNDFYATYPVGTQILFYFDTNATNFTKPIPVGRGILNISIGGSNHSVATSSIYPWQSIGFSDKGSGIVIDGGTNPPHIAGSGVIVSNSGGGTVGASVLDAVDPCYGGTGPSAGPASGTQEYIAGNHLSIMLSAARIVTPMGGIRIYGAQLDFGAGGIVTLNINNLRTVQDNGTPPWGTVINVPYWGNPWSTTNGAFLPWGLTNLSPPPPPPSLFASQGQIF